MDEADDQYRPKPDCPSLPQEVLRVCIHAHLLQADRSSRIRFPKVRPLILTWSELIDSMAYYWGLVGILMPLTIYRPAYSVAGLKGSILNSSTWLLGWTVFILVRPPTHDQC
jgi:hypothetical protein